MVVKLVILGCPVLHEGFAATFPCAAFAQGCQCDVAQQFFGVDVSLGRLLGIVFKPGEESLCITVMKMIDDV